MRKKSHISLACYLVQDSLTWELQRHKKAFCLGNILPDCKPSFLTTKHEFDGTFDMLQGKIRTLTDSEDRLTHNERAYMRHLGEVVHYIADYFTFPHNDTYEGNLKDHCYYEKELKFGLRRYIKSGQAEEDKQEITAFASAEDLFLYIRRTHEEYLSRQRDVEDDCIYIVRICNQVVQAILQLLSQPASDLLCLA
ncbi:MAG: zinc dependent phospholipase C family protein [Lachnospiraceae bacterium]